MSLADLGQVVVPRLEGSSTLEACSTHLLGDNALRLGVLRQVRLGETTAGTLGGSTPYLKASSDDSSHCSWCVCLMCRVLRSLHCGGAEKIRVVLHAMKRKRTVERPVAHVLQEIAHIVERIRSSSDACPHNYCALHDVIEAAQLSLRLPPRYYNRYIHPVTCIKDNLADDEFCHGVLGHLAEGLHGDGKEWCCGVLFQNET